MAKKIRVKQGVISGESTEDKQETVTLFILKNVMGLRYGRVVRVPLTDSIRNHIAAGNVRVVQEEKLSVRVEQEEVVAEAEEADVIGEEEV